jgi:hypothetical protein
MKFCTGLIAVLIISLFASQAQANDRKIKVQAPGNANTTMEVKIATVDTKTVGDLMTETVTINLAAADVMNAMTKAAAIAAAINAQASNVTAAVDATDKTKVIITSVAGRSISRVDARPLKSGERDMLAALGPADGENPNGTALVGLDLTGTGSQAGTAEVDIAGTPFSVSTSNNELNTSVLDDLMTDINTTSSVYTADVVGDELQISGSVLGNDFSAFVSDAVGSQGYSYGFFEQSFPQPTPEPAALALTAVAAVGGLAMRKRLRSRPDRFASRS